MQLKQHQEENVEWIQRVRKGILADQPGLGKSLSALTAVGNAGTLIVAPKMILNTRVWQDEIEKWGMDPSQFTIAPYSLLNERVPSGVGKNGQITHKPSKKIREEYRGPFEAVIIDEAHNIKGRGNFWTEAVKTISKNADIIMPMTGTPIPNWSHELFTLLQIVNPTEAKPGGKYGGFWRWAEEWFDTMPTRFSGGNPVVGQMLGCTPRCDLMDPEHPCEHMMRFTAANLGEQWMRHYRDDCLDLPPLTFTDIETPLLPKFMQEYKRMKKDFVSVIDGHEVLAWSQGAKNVALDKLTTSPWLLHKQGFPSGGKFDRLSPDLEKLVASGEQVLVLAHYQDTVEACAQIAGQYGPAEFVHGGVTDRQIEDRVVRFKTGKSRVICGSLETLAEGVTLTMANTAIMVERSYKPSRNEQATFRIHRMGQEKPCTILKYLTPDTVDIRKDELLAAKTDHQMRTMSAAEFSRVL